MAYLDADMNRVATIYPQLVYSTPFFAAALAITMVAAFTFTRRKANGAWRLTWICTAGAFWAATEGMLYLGMSVETNLLLTYIQYIGITAIIPLTLLFALSVFGFEAWAGRIKPALFTMAASILLLVWSNPIHHLVFSDYYRIDTGPVPMLGLKHGPLWWAIIGYHYALSAAMSIVLMHTVATAEGVQRAHAVVILMAVAAVWIVNAVYVTGNSPIPNMDIGPLAFILVAVAMAWGFFRYNLLDVLPIAKDEIFTSLNAPILVLDEKDRILDLNPAAERLFRLSGSGIVGMDITQLIDKRPELANLNQTPHDGEIAIPLDGEERNFDLRISLLRDKKGGALARILIFQDITEHKRADAAMRNSERLQGVLEMAGAVCHDLSQPVMALLGYSELIRKDVTEDSPVYEKALKLQEQTRRLKETTHRLMRITRYETRQYLGSQIIDIEKSSKLAGSG